MISPFRNTHTLSPRPSGVGLPAMVRASEMVMVRSTLKSPPLRTAPADAKLDRISLIGRGLGRLPECRAREVKHQAHGDGDKYLLHTTLGSSRWKNMFPAAK